MKSVLANLANIRSITILAILDLAFKTIELILGVAVKSFLANKGELGKIITLTGRASSTILFIIRVGVISEFAV